MCLRPVLSLFMLMRQSNAVRGLYIFKCARLSLIMVANTSPCAFVVTRIFCAPRSFDSWGSPYIESTCLVCLYDMGTLLCFEWPAPFDWGRESVKAWFRYWLKFLCCFFGHSKLIGEGGCLPLSCCFRTEYGRNIPTCHCLPLRLGDLESGQFTCLRLNRESNSITCSDVDNSS